MSKPRLEQRRIVTRKYPEGYNAEELIIPADCDPEYRYWTGNGAKSLLAILLELKARPETLKTYCGELAFESIPAAERQDNEGLSWMNKA